MLKQFVASVAIVVVLTGTAVAGPLEDATAAYQEGDYATALQLLRPLAENRDANAANNLGYMYYAGLGVPQDYAEAVKWYRVAAEEGLVVAQAGMGLLYDNGLGVPANDAEAVKWYRLAAEQGLAEAQNNIGVIYAKGEDGLAKNEVEAVKWYRLAAERGLASAQANLGEMYFSGKGISRDLVLAHMWFHLAAGQGHEGARRKRREVVKLLTADQLAEARRLEEEWRPTGEGTRPKCAAGFCDIRSLEDGD